MFWKNYNYQGTGKKDFDVIPEFVREVLKERRNFQETSKEILIRQKLIFEMQLQEKKSLKNSSIIEFAFLDMSLIDVLAYCKIKLGFIPEKLFENARQVKYHKVFGLEQLPFKKDEIRIEKDEKEARKLHEKILDFYKQLGYRPTIVSVMPVEKRVNFILKNLN